MIREDSWIELLLEPLHVVRDPSGRDSLADIVATGLPYVEDAIHRARSSRVRLDPEIRTLATSYRFWYVRFALSVRPAKDLIVRFLSLDAALTAEGGDAIAWSMEPLRVDREVKRTIESGISGQLKLNLADVSSTAKGTHEFVTYQPITEAFNLNRSDPAWELRSFEDRGLSGVFAFHIVVRVSKGAPGLISVRIRADIDRRGFLWNYRAVRRGDGEETLEVRLDDRTAP